MSIYSSDITNSKHALGKRLLILAHHYQADEVVAHAHRLGDSLELARRAAETDAEQIVFCGVDFMAESAALLARPGQTVSLPDPTASCVMAEMAPADLVRTVVEKLSAGGRRIIPLAYVNTSAGVKAVCGAHGGTVCTSANAPKMLQWCLTAAGEDGAVLFLPDKNLAQNTANTLGMPESERLLLNIRQAGDALDLDAARDARLLIWPGCCAVHARFKPAQLEAVRAGEPEARIIVHPECAPELVALAHGTGSTTYLINYCEEAPEGARIYVGTEINLVNRLAKKYQGVKTILPLAVSGCSNMAKTTPAHLATLLSDIAAKKLTPDDPRVFTVSEAVAEPARLALTRMLDASK